jgi:agmatinase
MLKFQSTKNNFLAIEKEFSNLETAKIVILPVPYESTTSYGKGTKNGPKGIINSSAYVEFYDDEFDSELCFDKGIVTLKPIEFNGLTGKKALKLIEENVKRILDMNKFIVTIGGEHTLSTATIKAHYNKYPDMSILHFDAHSDLRDEYEGTKYSHACFMARVIEFFPPEKITQVGIRAQCIEESLLIKNKKIKTFYASAIRRKKYGVNWQKKVADTLGNKIYITFDVDYFDPCIMPSTGTPEPDGFLYSETLDVFREIIKSNKQIIGFDIVELSPVKGINHPDITASRLLYKMLNFAYYNK